MGCAGSRVPSRVTSLREVTWERFQPNFFAVFSPPSLEGAPKQYVLLSSVTGAPAVAELQRDVVSRFPNVSSLDLSVIKDAVARISAKGHGCNPVHGAVQSGHGHTGIVQRSRGNTQGTNTRGCSTKDTWCYASADRSHSSGGVLIARSTRKSDRHAVGDCRRMGAHSFRFRESLFASDRCSIWDCRCDARADDCYRAARRTRCVQGDADDSVARRLNRVGFRVARLHIQRIMRIRSLPLQAAAIAFAIFGCSGGTEPSVPSSVNAGSSTPSATAGLALAAAPTFSVKDANGKILGGVSVTVTVTAGGGTLANAPTSTTSDSPTSIGTWTLGKTAGVNTVTVTVGSLAPLVITVTGVAGPAAAIVILSGNSQTALAGTTLANPVVAQVRDQFGNGVAGSLVTFFVTAGGGSINPAQLTTDAFGNAVGAIWRLGKTDVPQAATATSTSFSTLASATITTAYNAEVRFFGPPPSPEAMGAFTAAAARIRAMVIGDVPDIDFSLRRRPGSVGLRNQRCRAA